MTRDDIIRMAREAGFETGVAGIGVPPNRISINDATDAPWMLEAMTKFAALVAAAEREACARVAEEPVEFTSPEASRIAAAIRARSQS